MSNTKYQITDDGFGIHTFELTKSGISRAEFDRIVSGEYRNIIITKREVCMCILREMESEYFSTVLIRIYIISG